MHQTPLIIKQYKQIPTAARKLAKHISGGEVIGLLGPLGSGKTMFTQALAKALGVTGLVSSPTFTLINEYPIKGDLRLYHMDTYRLKDADEALALGINEFITDPHAVTVIEWANKIAQLLPSTTIYVTLDTKA